MESNKNHNCIKLHKLIYTSTKYSRRAAENLIKNGNIEVNGKIIIDPIFNVNKNDIVMLNGDINITVNLKKDVIKHKVLILYNKPIGIISSMQGKNSLDFFTNKFDYKLFHVGRLDKETSGLLLLTNYGKLAQDLAHPSKNVKKTYIAQITPILKQKDKTSLLKGIKLEDGISKFDSLEILETKNNTSIIKIVLHSGKNRIIRRLFASLDYKINSLMRTRIGKYELGNLKIGKYRIINL
jgi:23S rRNA pseudouridine2605 synthase